MANEKDVKPAEKQAEKPVEKKADVKLDTAVVSKPVVKVVPVIAALEARARDLQRQGDYAGDSLLLEIANAAGTLKQKTAAALGKFDGDTAKLIAGLHEIL